jgi:acetylornithine deacetylase/succinyl-diaminopimelate desuccinylase-like protein
MSVTGKRLAEWLCRIVQIPSVTPEQAGPRAGVPGEARLGTHVAQWFRDFGGEVACEEVLPGRPNVYGIWHGRTERWAAVDVHMDTVGVEQMIGDPFSGRVQDGRVYGRGAVDTKASLGVALALLEAMHQSGIVPEANLLVAATVDEESGTRGAPALARWVRQQRIALDQLAVAEPTLCGPIHGHKGVLRLEFAIEGVSAHSCQPRLGKNAITAAARLALALDEEHERLLSLTLASALGLPVLTVTLIQGGRGINVVPDACSVSMDRRVVTGETAAEVKAALIDLAGRHCPLPFSVNVQREIDAFFQPPETAWVCQLAEWSGREPSVAPYCTNAWAYGGLARECAVIGPGSIDQAHADEEWVAIAELEKLAGIYSRWWGLE